MKSILSFLLAAFICSTTFAQTVGYKTIHDDPSEMRKLQFSVNALMANTFSDEDANQGFSNFGYSINAAYYPIIDKIGIEFNYQTGSDISTGFDLYRKTEIRGTYSLLSARNTKERRVTLSESMTTTTSALVPKTVQNNFEGRFSLIRNKGFFGRVPLDLKGAWYALYNNTSLGLGIQWRQSHALKVLIDDDYYAKSSAQFLLYGDFILGMGTGWESKKSIQSVGTAPSETEIEDAVKEADLASNFGYRIGAKYFAKTSGTIGLSFSTEVGYIPPNTALFFMLSMGITINLL